MRSLIGILAVRTHVNAGVSAILKEVSDVLVSQTSSAGVVRRVVTGLANRIAWLAHVVLLHSIVACGTVLIACGVVQIVVYNACHVFTGLALGG